MPETRCGHCGWGRRGIRERCARRPTVRRPPSRTVAGVAAAATRREPEPRPAANARSRATRSQPESPQPPPSPLSLTSPFDPPILALAAPTLVALAADPLLSLVDTGFAAALGPGPLAALGVDSAIFVLASFSFNFLSSATTPLVARALAAGDRPAAGRVVLEAGALALVAGTAVAAALLLGGDAALAAMGAADAGDAVLDPARAYRAARAPALPAALMASVGAGALRGLKDVKTPLAITLASNGLHAALAYGLMFGPRPMGVAGAATATAVAEWASAAAYAAALFRDRAKLGLEDGPPPVSPAGVWADFAPFAAAGAAVAARTALLLAVKTAAAATATRLGTVPAAAHQVLMQLWLLASFAVDSLAVAGQALVGEAVGREDDEGARGVAERLLVLGTLAGALLAASMLAAGSPLELALTGGDASVRGAVHALLPLALGILPLNAAVYVLDGVLLGAGDFGFLAAAMAVSAAGAGVALAAAPPTLEGVWVALIALMGGRAATLLWRFQSAGGPVPPRGGERDW